MKTLVPKTSIDIFNLYHQVGLGHMLRRRNFKEPEFHQSYQVVSDKSDKSEMIVHCSVTRLVQFPIGNLPSASTFTYKRGKGWNDTNINKYFTLKNQMMTLMKIQITKVLLKKSEANKRA
jgi:hypothetical protein